MKKPSPTYTVKKQKDGDYEVTLHNQTKVFSLKEVMLNFMEAQKSFKEIESQRNLNRAILTNIKDNHGDVIKMFLKLPKVKRAALVNYIQLDEKIATDDVKYRDVKKRHDKLKNELATIHAVIPSEDKKPTKSEQRRIDSLSKK